MKKVLTMVFLGCLLLSGCGQKAAPADPDRLQIVTTVFPAYDFARAAAGDRAEVTLLLPPGAESHSYEPTPADILAVRDCDLFIYLGGESDAWVDTILEAGEPTGTVMKMVDCVELLEEEEVEGMQSLPGHDHNHGDPDDHEDHDLGRVQEYDEHVWTDPANAAAITRIVGERLAAMDKTNGASYRAAAEGYAEQLAALDGEHAAAYRENAAAYGAELRRLDGEFAAFFASLPERTIVFGDRFPLRYFAEEYGLDYYAAFPGCSTQTEPSAATIAFLTDKVRAEGISTVWYIEFSNHLVADSIAEATGTKTAMFHTCHNVSKAELEGGATYVSLMEGNLAALGENLP